MSYEMGLRTGSWGPQLYMLSPHATVRIELAPADSPGVLVRIVEGIPAVPRELRVADVAEVDVCTSGGQPVLTLRPAHGTADLDPHLRRVDGAWELRVEGRSGQSLHLYAQPGTPFPSSDTLDRLAGVLGDRTT